MVLVLLTEKNGKIKPVVITFYLRLRTDFKLFFVQNQASDWLTLQIKQSLAWFLARNGFISLLNFSTEYQIFKSSMVEQIC